MIVLIPAYEPDGRLCSLVRALLETEEEFRVVVIDDGSSAAYRNLFADVSASGATVIRHETNQGKGAALRTGFAYVRDAAPGEGVVTADADGQHTPTDIRRVAAELRVDAAEGRVALILGAREFTGDVPLRSRLGNDVSRWLFRIAAGWSASDTQTGLRGFPAVMLPWLIDLPGERFAYEMEMLLRLRRGGYTARQIPIETVYLERNSSSHFRPIVDSLRVTLPLLAFAASSLVAFLIDTIALLILSSLLSSWLTGWLVVSIVMARLLSASVNFLVNRRFVFARSGRTHSLRYALRYAALAGALLASNVVWMEALTDLGLPLIAAKAVTEGVLFVTSYQLQRRLVFRPDAQRTEQIPVIAAQKPHSSPIVPSSRMSENEPHLERTP